MKSYPDEERRVAADRRQTATSIWHTLVGSGRRMRRRRRDEHQRPYFVDRFSATTLVLILVFLLLSIVDAVITIHLLRSGCDEANPLMARLLEWGILPFLVGKYILTAAGLPLLLVIKNFTLFGTRFRVDYLLPVLVVLYVILLLYQVSLLRTHAEL